MFKVGGVFAVARSVWTHTLFAKEPFTKREAWLWLVSEARWKPGHYQTQHAGKVFLERGELCLTESQMAEAFGWNKSKVHRLLNRLHAEDMIDRTTKRTDMRGSNRAPERTGFQVISIRHYNDFQVFGQSKRTGLNGSQEASETSGANRIGTENRPTSEPNTSPATPCTLTGVASGVDRSEPATEPTPEPEYRKKDKKDKQADPPSAAQQANQTLWSDGLATLASLEDPSMGELRARKLIGQWLSRKNGIGANAENVSRAIRAAADAGTLEPIPFIVAILKSDTGVRRDGDCWLIPHGSPEYTAHRNYFAIDNSPEIYQWPDTPGHVTRSKYRWPNRAAAA